MHKSEWSTITVIMVLKSQFDLEISYDSEFCVAGAILEPLLLDYDDSTNKCTCKVETVSGVCSEESGPSRQLCGHVLTSQQALRWQ